MFVEPDPTFPLQFESQIEKGGHCDTMQERTLDSSRIIPCCEFRVDVILCRLQLIVHSRYATKCTLHKIQNAVRWLLFGLTRCRRIACLLRWCRLAMFSPGIVMLLLACVISIFRGRFLSLFRPNSLHEHVPLTGGCLHGRQELAGPK